MGTLALGGGMDGLGPEMETEILVFDFLIQNQMRAVSN